MDLAQCIFVYLNHLGFSPVTGCKGMSILRRELASLGLIWILAGLKELLIDCDIWAWIINVSESSFRSKLLAFCLVFGFPLSLGAVNSYVAAYVHANCICWFRKLFK